MRILGIDPGSTVTGYGVLEQARGGVAHVAHGTLRAPRGTGVGPRLAAIQHALVEVIELHRPDVAVVEQIFVAASPKAALVLGQARGVALAAVASAGVPLVEYGAKQIKQAATGSGAAAKKDVQTMVRRLLALERRPAADAADALAAALCHANAGPLGAAAASARRSRAPRSRASRFVLRRAP